MIMAVCAIWLSAGILLRRAGTAHVETGSGVGLSPSNKVITGQLAFTYNMYQFTYYPGIRSSSGLCVKFTQRVNIF
jgi:hypothetical protein